MQAAHAPFRGRGLTLTSSICAGTPEKLRRMTNDTNANIAETLTCEHKMGSRHQIMNSMNQNITNSMILTITDDSEWPMSENIVPIDRAINIYKASLLQ